MDEYPEPVDEEEPRPPLVLPRLRRLGLALLLIPVLVVSLSAVGMPRGYAIAVIIAGLVLLVALRQRAEDDDEW